METTGTWSEVNVAGHACEIYEPSQPHPHGYSVLYLHGVHSQRLADKPVFNAQFARHGLRVVCPQTGPSWWTDKIFPEFDTNITTERYVIDQVLPFFAERWNIRPPAIGLLGTSMGGQGALRFAFKHPRTFPVAAALSPAIDYQLRWKDGDETLPTMYPDPEAARQDTATLHVHPLNWPASIWFACDPVDYRWHESADRLRMKMSALGIPFQCDLETSAGGHSFEYYSHMVPTAIEFLVDKLDAERRKL